MKRIREFEALRGFLALWVVIGHALKSAGYMPPILDQHGAANPGLAVDVFIMLSGFVIFDLLDNKQEGYGAFIARRFFRIFPLYIVALIAGAALAGTALDWMQGIPWRTKFSDGNMAIAQSTYSHLPAQFLAHLTGLHGLVPDGILPFSEYGIIGQAWSISVEWQFYLVAPLLFFLAREKPVGLIFVMGAIVLLHSRYWLGEGFSINQAQYFLIGVASYFGYKHCPKIAAPYLLLGAVVAMAIFQMLVVRPVSLCIWALFLGAALSSKFGQSNSLSKMTTLGWCQNLGKISYSVYLLHFFVIVVISDNLLHLFPHFTQAEHIAVLLPSTVAASLLLASLTYLYIEKPGMDFGRDIAKKIAIRFAVPESA